MMSNEAIRIKNPKNTPPFAGSAKLNRGIIKMIYYVFIIDHK